RIDTLRDLRDLGVDVRRRASGGFQSADKRINLLANGREFGRRVFDDFAFDDFLRRRSGRLRRRSGRRRWGRLGIRYESGQEGALLLQRLVSIPGLEESRRILIALLADAVRHQCVIERLLFGGFSVRLRGLCGRSLWLVRGLSLSGYGRTVLAVERV